MASTASQLASIFDYYVGRDFSRGEFIGGTGPRDPVRKAGTSTSATCAASVCQVLEKHGISVPNHPHSGGHPDNPEANNSSPVLRNNLRESGWASITSPDSLTAGTILFVRSEDAPSGIHTVGVIDTNEAGVTVFSEPGKEGPSERKFYPWDVIMGDSSGAFIEAFAPPDTVKVSNVPRKVTGPRPVALGGDPAVPGSGVKLEREPRTPKEVVDMAQGKTAVAAIPTRREELPPPHEAMAAKAAPAEGPAAPNRSVEDAVRYKDEVVQRIGNPNPREKNAAIISGLAALYQRNLGRELSWNEAVDLAVEQAKSSQPKAAHASIDAAGRKAKTAMFDPARVDMEHMGMKVRVAADPQQRAPTADVIGQKVMPRVAQAASFMGKNALATGKVVGAGAGTLALGAWGAGMSMMVGLPIALGQTVGLMSPEQANSLLHAALTMNGLLAPNADGKKPKEAPKEPERRSVLSRTRLGRQTSSSQDSFTGPGFLGGGP